MESLGDAGGGGSDNEEHMGETVCICGKIREKIVGKGGLILSQNIGHILSDFPSRVYEDDVFMIQCDICRDWLHGDCIKIDELTANDIDKYHCPRCEPICGPSIMKVETNWHRHDKTDPDASSKPLQVGTKLFVEELSRRIFSPADDIIMKVSGKQLTLPYLNQSGFNHPILVTDKDGLSMSVPQFELTVDGVVGYLGEDHMVDVIDVHRQQTCHMSLAHFATFFNNEYSDRVLNCLSLEVTETNMSEVFSPPLVARKLCWVNNVWPSHTNLPYQKPQVQKYCIMSMAKSYTDFHIDFGGTSVWYHVLTGEKYFYFIRPTAANISLYERWTRLSTQSESFLGDMVDRCYLLKLTAGQTLFIPTGWIHAVFTPVNSIVLGGNFLHSLNIQLQVVHWLAAGKLKKDLADLNSDNTPCPTNLLNGIRTLVTTLKSWITDAKRPVISGIDCAGILKDLSREVKNAERISLKVNPPKPERESNRRRKKKSLDDDFIDLSDPSSLYLLDSKQDSSASKKSRVSAAAIQEQKVIAIKSKPMATNAGLDVVAQPQFPIQERQFIPQTSELKLNISVPKESHYQDGAIIDNRGEMSITKRMQESLRYNSGYDLTDRDSVRQLLTTRKQQAGIGGGVATTTVQPTTQASVTAISANSYHAATHQHQLNSVLNAAAQDFAGEDDNDGLVIDEDRRPGKRKSIKLRLSVGSSGSNAETQKSLAQIDPAPYPQLDSPATRDAVAGMLSMSQKPSKLHPKMAVKASLKKKIPMQKYKEEVMTKVYQDDEFIYPALDMSDDEDFKPAKSKQMEDEAWNPKMKMSRLEPKKDRPVRDSAKNIAIEKGLKQAAEARRSFKSGKRKSKGKTAVTSVTGATAGGVGSGILGGKMAGSVASPSKPVIDFTKSGNSNRSRKTCSTAKQRLGKILGLKF